jgi:hypothetical protein
MLGLVGVILVVIVVILMLLIFRSCGTESGSGTTGSNGKEIVPVGGLEPDPGVVSAWVQQGTDIAAVLRVAGLENSTITNMGGGRYVISVPAGTEDAVVRILSQTTGVYDAGLVYDATE